MMMICFFIAHSAFADIKPESLKGDEPSTDIFIEVTGPQSGVWISGNEYHVIGDISVSSGETLIIEHGVTIKFMDYYSFNINGTLIANGTETEQILFTSGQQFCNPNDWNEIKFKDSSNDNSIISYATIEYADYGIFCKDSSPTLSNNSISNNNKGIYCHASSPVLSNNTISNNYLGIQCYASFSTISNNIISNNSFTGIFCSSSSPSISNNTINNNINSNGIFCHSSSPLINNNNISNNKKGIYYIYSSPLIVNNIIYENNIGVEASSVATSLEYNLFWGNDTTATGEDLPVDFGEIVAVNVNGDPCDNYMNLFMDPFFVYPDNFNFHLTENSPCIDAGNPDPVYYDPDSTIADIGAFYFDYSQLHAIFLADTTIGNTPLSVQFADLSYSLNSLLSWQWDFNNDGTIDSEEPNPEWIYTEAGLYTVSLTVSDGENEDTELKEDYIIVSETGTYIQCGNVSGIWTYTNSPYFIMCEIEIEHNEQLIIEPGVTIKFMDYYSFNISGTLIASGTETDSILFTSGQTSCNLKDWSEIKFESLSNDNSIISYATIEFGNFGIYCKNSSLTLSNNTINNNYWGIFYEECLGSSLTLSNNSICYNDYGIWCIESSPSISNNTIGNNYYGIHCDSSSPAIRSNTISNNTSGIVCTYSHPSISNNTINNNSNNGIFCHYSSPLINNNTISNNNNIGIYSIYSSSPLFVNNIIYENNIGIEASSAISSLEYNLFWGNNTTAIGYGLPTAFGEIVTINANEDPCDIYYNLFMDPLFVDPVNFNFHLTENSPCIDAGNPDPIYYDPDGTIADMGAFYYNQSQVTQQISLYSGFSFVSSHIIPENPVMLAVVEEILNDNLDFIRNSQGQTLRKIGPNWVNGIGDWIVDEGYLVKMFAADSFTINGLLVDPTTPIPVEAGFQFVSYFPETSMDALLAFETIIGDDLDFIRDSEGTMIRKIGPNWVNGIGDCQPGEGYLVKMFADGVLFYPGSSSFTCGDPFTDPRDGQIYNTVLIGDQCWMAENLNIGEMINGSEEMSDNSVIEKYCYDNNPANCDEYGALYQWNEMMQYVTTQGVQGICPEGWYITTDDEWKILEGTVDSQYPVGDPIWNSMGWRGFDAGLNIKSTNGWYAGGNGSRLYGYEALPGGFRSNYGGFGSLSSGAHFWSSSEHSTSYPLYRVLYYDNDNVLRGTYDKSYGFSVRCLKDNSNFGNSSIIKDNRFLDLLDTKTKNIEAVHFIFKGGNPAEAVYTLYIEGLNIGDEVAAFDEDKMIGAIKINSENAFENELPVFSTLINGVGYEGGNPIILRVWSENNIVSADFTMEQVYDSYVSDVYPEGDGKYSIVNISKGKIENKDETISIYPNPSTGIITIQNLSVRTSLIITDITGKTVHQLKINDYHSSIEVDLSQLEKGIYFICLKGKDFSHVKKIVIQ